MSHSPLIALAPRQFPAYVEAIETAGGKVRPLGSDTTALVWTDYGDPEGLKNALENNPQLTWVQLPFAGVDAFSHLLHFPLVFTSAKRAYAEPVAEHALTLALALGRTIPERVRATSWGKKFAQTLFDCEVVIVGGGGIAEVLVRLLTPFRAKITVIRKRTDQLFTGDVTVKSFDYLDVQLRSAQFIFLACALTDETRFLFNSQRFEFMRPDAYLINVARGEIVNQEALLAALQKGVIAGAATDVTYPEPLPENHPMWHEPKLLITPHTADTPQIITELFSQRLRENVSAWIAGSPLNGVVDPVLGY